MNTLTNVFPNRHTFLAVVHMEDCLQALRNAQIAYDQGADGIFLINHAIPYPQLIDCYHLVKNNLPDFWIGLNCLDLLPSSAVTVIPNHTAGLWVDNAGVNESSDPTGRARQFQQARESSGWQGLYFGGVAFKYQKEEVTDFGRVARLAIPFVDVITTSGEGTGKAAPIEKIRLMKEAIGTHPLAIASGITPENISEYMPYIDCFLVATGISYSHTELNPSRVRSLVKVLGK